MLVPPPLVKDIGALGPNGNNGGGAMTDDEVVNRALQHNKVNSGSMSLFPQQDAAGNLSQQPRSCQIVCTETDATKQIRRGEAVWVGGQWFRVSSSVGFLRNSSCIDPLLVFPILLLFVPKALLSRFLHIYTRSTILSTRTVNSVELLNRGIKKRATKKIIPSMFSTCLAFSFACLVFSLRFSPISL